MMDNLWAILVTRARLFKILDKVVHWTNPYPVDS